MPRGVRLAVLLLSLLALCVPARGRAASSYGTPVPGKHIYDLAGVLTPDQLSDLERRAALVDQAGAPTVVYIRMKDVSYNATAADAQTLMDEWDVESAPGAHDGLVIFVNLSSVEPVHGNAALYAGARHYQGGKLPKSELQAIYDRSMAPALKNDDLHGALAAGLDAAAQQLRFGTVPSDRIGTIERALRWPLYLLSLAGAALVGWVAWRVWRSRPTALRALATTTPPGAIPPAVAGAVVAGQVTNQQLEATLLDLARRGALSIEPAKKHKAQIRLRDARVPSTELERWLWDRLAVAADPDGVVSSSRLATQPRQWNEARDVLQRSLEAQGLFDPAIGARRNPGYIAGAFALLFAFGVGKVAGGIDNQWSALSIGLLVASAGAAIWASMRLPSTTPAGEKLAADWRGYRDGIKANAKGSLHGAELDLDTVFPYAVALGMAGALDHRLKEADRAGYNPAWLNQTLEAGQPRGTRPYSTWSAFHSSVTPSSSGSGSGGGASSGGGSAGGSF